MTKIDDETRLRHMGASWGKSVVATLSKDLQTEFPGISGFSAANLWRMKLFYETYSHNEKLAPMVREIGWTHNLVIVEKCKDDLEHQEEVIDMAFRLLEKLYGEYEQWIEETRNKIDIGIAELDRGEELDGEAVVVGILERFKQARQNRE